jgi:ankyrin repeat protein
MSHQFSTHNGSTHSQSTNPRFDKGGVSDIRHDRSIERDHHIVNEQRHSKASANHSFDRSGVPNTRDSNDVERNETVKEQRHSKASKLKSDGGKREDLIVQEVTSESPTKLFSLIAKHNWVAALKRLQLENYKREAEIWVIEHNTDGSLRWKLLPIHQACENKAPSELIKKLIAAYPDSLMRKDSGGFLPLHLACRERSSKSVVAALLSTEPGAAKVKDDEGRLALHLACRQGVAVQIVDSLIVCNHRAVETADHYGLLPIHWACAQNATAAIIESLLRAYPSIHDVKDKWDRTPLSLVKASTNPEKSLIIEALARDPSYWKNQPNEIVNNLKQNLETSTVDQERVQKLENENAALRHKLSDLTGRVKYGDEDIDKINEENKKLMSEVNDLKKKMNEFSFIFRGMEDQRRKLIRITQDMDKSLRHAMDVAGSEHFLQHDDQDSI